MGYDRFVAVAGSAFVNCVVAMRKFGAFLLALLLLCIIGGGAFLAFWDMPIQSKKVSVDITKEIANDRLPK